MIHDKAGARYWCCVKCYDIPYKFVMDRRDGQCTTHGEVTEVKLEAIPPRRTMPLAPELSEHELRGGEPLEARTGSFTAGDLEVDVIIFGKKRAG